MESVVVATFTSRIEAELAASRLEALGIPASVAADDAGGALPSLQLGGGATVLVAAEHRYRAQELLGETPEPKTAAPRSAALGWVLVACAVAIIAWYTLQAIGQLAAD